MEEPLEKPEFSKKKAFPPSWNIISRFFAPYRTHLFAMYRSRSLSHVQENQMHKTGANLCGNSIKPVQHAAKPKLVLDWRSHSWTLFSHSPVKTPDTLHTGRRGKICLRIASTENFLPARYRPQMRRFSADEDFDRTREVLGSSIDVCKQLFRMLIYY